jgi:cyclase
MTTTPARLSVAVVLLTVAPAGAQQGHVRGAGADVRHTVLAEGVHQFTIVRDSYVRQLNSVAIVNERDVLVFDTNTRPSSARLVLAAIRKLTDKPVRLVVNSHWHPDHWSGNEVYAAAFPEAEFVSTALTQQFMRTVSGAWPAQLKEELKSREEAWTKAVASGARLDGTPLTPQGRKEDEEDLADYRSLVDELSRVRRVYPTATFVNALTLQRGTREIRLLSVTGDAEGTAVLYLPKEKILVTGDAVSYPIPYITPPPSRHAAALRELARLDVEVIVPGHGPAFRDRNFLELEAELLETVVKDVRTSLQSGMRTLADVQAAVTAEPLRTRFTGGDKELDERFRDRVKVLVKLAVREARDGQDLR